MPYPLVIDEGQRKKLELLEIVKGAGEGYVWGVSIGGNVFQQQGPTKMLKAICALICQGATAQEAWGYPK